jgi:glutamate--cysteine ligase regulatory subunit
MSSDLQNENSGIKFEPVLSPLFPKATEILFYTGNTLALLKLMKKTNTSISEEILETMSMMLQGIRTEGNEKQFENETYVKFLPSIDETSITYNNNSASPDQEQLTREDLKFSVKIFLRSLEPELLSHTIDTILNELKENYLESVMISLPNYSSEITLNDFLPLWRIVEDYIDKQKILSAGVCDFMLPLFSDLCNACKHKPYANQINLGVCCSIPEELNKYVKENNIQLLTHSDPIDVINESDFQEILREYCHENDVNNWKPLSTVRYNSVIANRGIIKSKGFFIYAKRELHI